MGDQSTFDASNILSYVEKRDHDFNLPYDSQVIDGKLSSLFILLKPGLKYLKSRGVVLKIVFFDTTFNTTPRDFKYFNPGFNKINNDDSLPSITWES